jgi:hypothetical protein
MGHVRRVRESGELKAKFVCSKCGNCSEHDVINVQDGSRGCWSCIAGPDQMMLREVRLKTEAGCEIVLVHAKNNLEAFKMVAKPGVLEMIARPLVN